MELFLAQIIPQNLVLSISDTFGAILCDPEGCNLRKPKGLIFFTFSIWWVHLISNSDLSRRRRISSLPFAMGAHTRDRASPCSQILICNVSNYLVLWRCLRSDKKTIHIRFSQDFKFRFGHLQTNRKVYTSHMRTFFNISKKIVEVAERHPNLGPCLGRGFEFLTIFWTKSWEKQQNLHISRSRRSGARRWWFRNAELPLRGVLNRFRVHPSTSCPPKPVILSLKCKIASITTRS